MKVCTQCKVGKEFKFFPIRKDSKDGFRNKCKECYKHNNKNYYENNKENLLLQKKEYYKNNKENFLIKNKENYENNKEVRLSNAKEYYLSNREEILKKQRKYILENKENKKEYYKIYFNNRLNTDKIFKLKHYIRSMIRSSFSLMGYSKSSQTLEILGCSFDEFKIYLESKFEDWMTWENRGLYNGELNYGWDIDHIIPLSSAKTEYDIVRLNHFSNLQPLCSYTNRYIKKDLII